MPQTFDSEIGRLFAGLGFVTVALTAGLSLRDPATRGRRLRLFAPVVGLLLLSGVPGLFAPVLSAERLRILCGLASLCGASWFAFSARRAHGRYSKAALAAKTSRVNEALSLLEGRDGGVDVTIRGLAAGDPPLIAPVSHKPCARYRVEVRRAVPGEPNELVALEESLADRLVLHDHTGEIALAGSVQVLTRRAPLQESVAEGEVDAAALGAEGDPVTRLARLARQLDPNPPAEGSFVYRIVERALLNETPVTVTGTLRRSAGEATLYPLDGRLDFEERRDAVGTLRRQAFEYGLLAVFGVLAGGFWLWP